MENISHPLENTSINFIYHITVHFCWIDKHVLHEVSNSANPGHILKYFKTKNKPMHGRVKYLCTNLKMVCMRSIPLGLSGSNNMGFRYNQNWNRGSLLPNIFAEDVGAKNTLLVQKRFDFINQTGIVKMWPKFKSDFKKV